jgi:hypothetical protein
MSIDWYELRWNKVQNLNIEFRKKYSKQKKIFWRDDTSKICMVLVTVF